MMSRSEADEVMEILLGVLFFNHNCTITVWKWQISYLVCLFQFLLHSSPFLLSLDNMKQNIIAPCFEMFVRPNKDCEDITTDFYEITNVCFIISLFCFVVFFTPPFSHWMTHGESDQQINQQSKWSGCSSLLGVKGKTLDGCQVHQGQCSDKANVQNKEKKKKLPCCSHFCCLAFKTLTNRLWPF